MLAAISSIDDVLSSAAADCSVAPCANCCAVALICWLPDATLSDAADTSPTVFRRFSIIRFIDVIICPSSSPETLVPCDVRSPSATLFTRSTVSASGTVIVRVT